MISWQGLASLWGAISLPPWILLLRNVRSPWTWRESFPSPVAQIRSRVLGGRLNLPFCSTGQDKALALVRGGNAAPGARGSVWCTVVTRFAVMPSHVLWWGREREPRWRAGKSRSSVPQAVLLLINDFSFQIRRSACSATKRRSCTLRNAFARVADCTVVDGH